MSKRRRGNLRCSVGGSHDEWVALLAAGGWLLATALRVDSLGFALFMEVRDRAGITREWVGCWLLAAGFWLQNYGFILGLRLFNGG